MWNRLQSLKEQANEAARKVELQGRAVAARAQQAIAEAALEDDEQDSRDRRTAGGPSLSQTLEGSASLDEGASSPRALIDGDSPYRDGAFEPSARDAQSGQNVLAYDATKAHDEQHMMTPGKDQQACSEGPHEEDGDRSQDHPREGGSAFTEEARVTPSLSEGKQRAAQLFRSFLGQDESDSASDDDTRVLNGRATDDGNLRAQRDSYQQQQVEELLREQKALQAELEWYREELQGAQGHLQSADEEQASISAQLAEIIHSKEQESEKLRMETQDLGLRLAEAESRVAYLERQEKEGPEGDSAQIRGLQEELAQVREELVLSSQSVDEDVEKRVAAEVELRMMAQQKVQEEDSKDREKLIAELRGEKAEMQVLIDKYANEELASSVALEEREGMVHAEKVSEKVENGSQESVVGKEMNAASQAAGLSFDLGAMRLELESFREKVQVLEAANAKTIADHEDALAQIVFLNNEKRSLNAEVENYHQDLRKQVASLQVDVHGAKRLIEEMQFQAEQAEKVHNTAMGTIQNQLEELEQEGQSFDIKFAAQDQALVLERKRVAGLEAQVQELESLRLRAENALVEEQHKASAIQLEIEDQARALPSIAELERKNAELETNVAVLIEQIEESRVSFESERADWQAQVRELESYATQSAEARLDPDASAAASEVAQYIERERAFCKRIDEVLHDLTGEEPVNDQSERPDLEQFLDALLNHVEQLRKAEVERLETEPDRDLTLRRDVNEPDSAAIAMAQEMDDLRRALDANSSERDAALARSLNYEYRIEELESELRTLKQEKADDAESHESVLAELEEDLEQTGARLMRERETRQRIEAECSRLSSEYTALSEKYHRVSDDFSRKSLLFAEQEEKMIAMEHEFLSAQDEVEHLRETIRGTHAVNASRLESEIARLEKELSQSRTRIAELELEQEKLGYQLQHATDDLVRAHAEIASHVESEHNLQQVLEQFQVEQEAQHEIVSSDVKRQLKAEQQRVSELGEELAIKTRIINRSVEELEKKENTVIDLRTRVELLTDAHVQLKSELEKSLARIYESETQNELVDRRVVRQLIVNYFQVEPRRRHDVLELMTRVLEFSPRRASCRGAQPVAAGSHVQ